MMLQRAFTIGLAGALAVGAGFALASDPQRRTCKYVVIAEAECSTYDVGDIYCICAVGGCPSYEYPAPMNITCDEGTAKVVNYSGTAECKYGDPCAQP